MHLFEKAVKSHQRRRLRPRGAPAPIKSLTHQTQLATKVANYVPLNKLK